eukprot:scaffold54971_cov47-Attheya_sp.AAC.2
MWWCRCLRRASGNVGVGASYGNRNRECGWLAWFGGGRRREGNVEQDETGRGRNFIVVVGSSWPAIVVAQA